MTFVSLQQSVSVEEFPSMELCNDPGGNLFGRQIPKPRV
jgi:hypothetical protein